MNYYKFYKEEKNWYVDLPEWEGSKSDLLMVGGADTMLDIISNNGTEVLTAISETHFEGASKLEYVRPADEIGEGSFYLLKEYEGKELNLSVFLCDVTLFVFGKFPETIYLSVTSATEALQNIADKSLGVRFGLEAQGHIPTIERMIAEYSSANEINVDGVDLSHSSFLWNKIAKEIGWDKETAMLHYISYLRNKQITTERQTLRDLVDNVWQYVKESEEVPSTIVADELIDKVLKLQNEEK